MRLLEERDELKLQVDRLTDDLDRKGKQMLQSLHQERVAWEAKTTSLKRKLSQYKGQETQGGWRPEMRFVDIIIVASPHMILVQSLHRVEPVSKCRVNHVFLECRERMVQTASVQTETVKGGHSVTQPVEIGEQSAEAGGPATYLAENISQAERRVQALKLELQAAQVNPSKSQWGLC